MLAMDLEDARAELERLAAAHRSAGANEGTTAPPGTTATDPAASTVITTTTVDDLIPKFGILIDDALIAAVTGNNGSDRVGGTAPPTAPPTTTATAPTPRSDAVTLADTFSPKFGIPIDEAPIAAVTGVDATSVKKSSKIADNRTPNEEEALIQLRSEHNKIIDQMQKSHAATIASQKLEIKRLRAELLATRNQANEQPKHQPPSPPSSPPEDVHVRSALEQRILMLHANHTLRRCVRKWVQRALHKKRESARAAE